MHHFLVDPEDIHKDIVTITGGDVKHITRSLRLNEGDEITIADGQGEKYLVKLVELTDEFVKGEIAKEFTVVVEPEVKVTLIQGLPKSKKMDLITQKCTELGIEEIIPMETARTVVKLKPSKAKRRQKRWQKIAKEAAKQSGRAKIPTVGKLINFKNMLSLVSEYDLALIPWEDEEQKGLKAIISDQTEINKIIIIIGPEGGFSKEEISAAKEAGIYPVTLGPRILRTETAGIATLSMLLYELGDLG